MAHSNSQRSVLSSGDANAALAARMPVRPTELHPSERSLALGESVLRIYYLALAQQQRMAPSTMAGPKLLARWRSAIVRWN